MRGRRLARRLTAPLLVAALTLAGCRAGRGAAGGAESFPLRIENRNYYDVTIFLEGDGPRRRVGQVGGSRTADLALPARAFDGNPPLRLAAETVGARGPGANDRVQARRVVSDRLMVAAGQRLVWTLESGLERSHLGVYPDESRPQRP